MSKNQHNSDKTFRKLYVVERGQARDPNLPKHAVIAEIGRHIFFDPAALDTFDVKGFELLHYDMLVVCAAVEFADRRWKRPPGWSRRLDLTVPVFDLENWQRPEVLRSLQGVMKHLTGDVWRFSFIRARNTSTIGSRQMPLDFGNNNKTFVVAYSDGLDSRAVSALSGNASEALCIRISGTKQRWKSGESYFTEIPFKVHRYRGYESSFRSRGFKFAIVTAIAAQLSSVRRIVVPESGQGALGPALLPLHNVYADYRNHPTFFRKVEQFIRALLSYQVFFEQPRLWYTKGQTLLAFLNLPTKSTLDLVDTHSCWQTRRVVNVGRRRQCGLCAACLLRRVSLHAADVKEAADTYVVSDLATPDLVGALSVIPGRADRDIMIEYGSVGARHLQHLAKMATLPDEALQIHVSQIAAATAHTYEATLERLRAMLLSHAEEWRVFLVAQGDDSFLNRWMDGGRCG